MHDLDHLLREFEDPTPPSGESADAEWPAEESEGPTDEWEGTLGEGPLGDEWEDDREDDELEAGVEAALAAELLSTQTEEELEYFLGKLISSAGKAIKGFANSKVGRALGGVLKKVGGKLLPLAGGALGGMFGGPLGAKLGSSLGSGLGRVLKLDADEVDPQSLGEAFGFESEGLSTEEAEFEAARRFVRLAHESARIAARAPSGAPPEVTARSAVLSSARRHAPGLVRTTPTAPRPAARPGAARVPAGQPGVPRRTGGAPRGGWVRHGNHLVLIDFFER